MKNRKLARFLLWSILVITLTPTVLCFFTPGIPVWLIGIGIMFAAICIASLLPRNHRTEQLARQIESRKPILQALIAVPAILFFFVKGFPGLFIWIALAALYFCISITDTHFFNNRSSGGE